MHALQIMSLMLMTAAPVEVPAESVRAANPEEVGLSGFEVVVDPTTGRIINSPELLAPERRPDGVARERRSSWDLRVFYLDGGGRGVELDGWADHALSVVVAEDGTMRLACSQGDDHSHVRADGAAAERKRGEVER